MTFFDALIIYIASLLTIAPEPMELSCPKTVIIDTSNEKWTEEDEQTVERAKKRCSELYLHSPCLKRFLKKRTRTYNAICGPKE